MGKFSLSLIAVGLILVALSIVCGFFSFPSQLQNPTPSNESSGRARNSHDEPGGPEPGPWDLWEDLSTQYFMTVRVFHTLNPDQVSNGEKPILQERGPYVYQEKRVIQQMSESNETMTYRKQIHYFFRPDLSNGTEQDEVTVLNIPLALLVMKHLNLGPGAQSPIESAIQKHENRELLFWRVTIRELLFSGRRVPIVETLYQYYRVEPFRLNNYTFGIFYPKNGSDEGTLEVKTTVADFGKVVNWNGKTKLNFWKGETCNMINGTDGSLFAPFVERNRTVYLFSPDLCRSLYLTYTQDTELKGIKGYRFGVPRAALAGPKENQANECFCLEPATDYNNCLGAGAIQLSACRNGAPIVMSTPHFFNGDQKYVNAASGLKPNKDEHQTFIDLEPDTGFILRSHKRFQVNIPIAPNDLSPHFSSVPKMMYPILWYDEHAEMSDATAKSLQNPLFKRGRETRSFEMLDTGKWILLGVGLFSILVGIIGLVVSRKEVKIYEVRESIEEIERF